MCSPSFTKSWGDPFAVADEPGDWWVALCWLSLGEGTQRRRSRLLILCLILTACGQVSSSPSPALTLAPPEIVDPMITAAQVLKIARTMLPRVEVDLGQSAMLGDPLPVYGLSGLALRAFRPGTPLASVLTPRLEWMIPVLVQGEGRQLMMVGFEGSTWRVIGFGGYTRSRDATWRGFSGSMPTGSTPSR